MTDHTTARPPTAPSGDPTTYPLPPAAVVEEMLKQEDVTAPARPLPEPAKLNFLGDKPWSKTITLDFPFEHEGRVVTEITVTRLTTAAMGKVVDNLGEGFTRWDLIAAIAGFPVEVLRGLEAGDGDAVMEVALDFLPKALKG
jgi:hypothetical protein